MTEYFSLNVLFFRHTLYETHGEALGLDGEAVVDCGDTPGNLEADLQLWHKLKIDVVG